MHAASSLRRVETNLADAEIDVTKPREDWADNPKTNEIASMKHRDAPRDAEAMSVEQKAKAAPSSGSGARAEKGKARSSATRAGLVRLNVDVTYEISDFLDDIAEENGVTKSEVMRRAIALLRVANEEKKRKRSMGFVSEARDTVLETKIVGVL